MISLESKLVSEILWNEITHTYSSHYYHKFWFTIKTCWSHPNLSHPVVTEAFLESGLYVTSQYDVHIKEILRRGSHPFSFTQFLPPRWLLDVAPSVTQDTSIYMGRSYTSLEVVWLTCISLTEIPQALAFPYSCTLNVLTAGSRFARKLLVVIRASSSRLQGIWIVYLHLRYQWAGSLHLHLHLQQTCHSRALACPGGSVNCNMVCMNYFKDFIQVN